jgi:hypothetical protein
MDCRFRINLLAFARPDTQSNEKQADSGSKVIPRGLLFCGKWREKKPNARDYTAYAQHPMKAPHTTDRAAWIVRIALGQGRLARCSRGAMVPPRGQLAVVRDADPAAKRCAFRRGGAGGDGHGRVLDVV